MPSSNPETIPIIIGIVWNLAPKSVLDVGAGYGKYGVLFREYLELRHGGDAGSGSYPSVGNRSVRIDAVEGFGPYIGELHRAVYDHIYVENLQQFMTKQWNYDLIFLGDVLEHFCQREVRDQILPALVQRAEHGVVISVPAAVQKQGAVFGNDLEVHRSQWTVKDLNLAAPYAHVGLKGSHLVAFLTRQENWYKKIRGNPVRRTLRALKHAARDSW